MEDQYKGLPRASDDWMSYESFRAQINGLDNTSSPGWPYMKSATTIGKWLGADGLGHYDERQIAILWHDVQRVLANDYEHLFRVFVKDEPHKRNKIIANKWRLIIASALPVQMVWRMAFDHQNRWLNDHPYDTPSAHGLVFPHGGWRRFKAMVETEKLIYSRDISAWDVNMPGSIVYLVREFRKTAGGPASWLRVVDMLYRDAFRDAKLLFSSGRVVQQTYWGFMKSGLFNTISDNSLGMVGMHRLAATRARIPVGSIKATGDDVLQSIISDTYLEELELLGCKVKEITKAPVFMGTDFTDRPKPVYFSKHVVNIASTTAELEEVLDSYVRLYCYSEHLEFWECLARELGIRIKSKRYYQFWYGSPIARLMYGWDW